MEIFISILVTSVITSLIFLSIIKTSFISKKKLRKVLEAKRNKRGLLKFEYLWNVDNRRTKVIVTSEVTVIDKTKDMVKLENGEIEVNNWTFGKEQHMTSYKRSINTWFDINDKRIIWFNEDDTAVKKKNIKDLLK